MVWVVGLAPGKVVNLVRGWEFDAFAVSAWKTCLSLVV